MGKNNNIIMINGKHYDARSGAQLSGHHHQPTTDKSHAPKPKAVVTKPTMRDVVRAKPKHAASHAPKPSRTLMRHIVKKPSRAKKQPLRAQGYTDQLSVKPLADVVVSNSAKSLDPKRLQQASKIKQSHKISHFSDITSDINKLALAPKPDLPAALVSQAAPESEKSGKVAKPKTTAELLEHAIKQAKGHEDKSHLKPKKRRLTGKLAGSVVAVMLVAFVGYQELPDMRLQIASAKAGFSASLPNYQPSGYSLGQLQYSPGVVASKFESNSDNRTYTITQKASSWDSRSLLDSFVKPTTEDYQTVQSAGQTIYIYDNNATWVNSGVWYVVQSDGSLSNRQLVELATSL